MQKDETINIDGKYSIRINNGGANVEMLRHGEEWICGRDLTAQKPWISAAYEIEMLRTALKNIREEFRIAPKPDAAYMADTAIKALGTN